MKIMNVQVFYQLFLTIILMFIYLKGYFPISHNETIIVEPPDKIGDIPLNVSQLYMPQIDRLVLIIIDALRYDFVTEDQMSFLVNNMDCMLKMKVEAPTVTLPRIKSITTGAVPQFIDIVLNLGSRAKVDDSFLHRAKAVGKQMVFYGDDTWLAMFPDSFVRSEGTSSFFVSDYTEVDDNVTRNIPMELQQDDWDMMFLHYLGLDHIGHVRGPFSSLIKPKLHEMDGIIKMIITEAKEWNKRTLILVTGDHGMKDSGGHGGTTYAEIYVPLIAYSNRGRICKKQLENVIFPQTDISNTISALFGISMPANSIGKVLPALLNAHNDQLLYILYYNSVILRRTSHICLANLERADTLFKDTILNVNRENTVSMQLEAMNLYQDCLHQMSDDLISSSVTQDAYSLIFAIIGTMYSFLIVVNVQIGHTTMIKQQLLQFFLAVSIIMMFLLSTSSIFKISCILLMGFMTLQNAIKLIGIDILKLLVNASPLVIHGVLMPSSSFIEFEEQIFYFYTCTASILIACVKFQESKRVAINTVMALFIIEIIRFARGLDSKWLLEDDNYVYLQSFHLFSLVITSIVSKILLGTFPICQPIVLILIYMQKFHFEKCVGFAQVIWVLILGQFVVSKLDFHARLLNVWILTASFLLRPYNSILIPAIIICSLIYKHTVSSIAYLTCLHIWLGYTFFFLQGHTNSIANIDLAPGYTGLSTYIPFLVGLLTICHSYTFPTLSLILLCHKLPKNSITTVFNIVVSYKLFILIVIYIIIYIHRSHLFVWSVFAPKLLIESMHTFVLAIQCMCYVLYKIVLYFMKRKLDK